MGDLLLGEKIYECGCMVCNTESTTLIVIDGGDSPFICFYCLRRYICGEISIPYTFQNENERRRVGKVE